MKLEIEHLTRWRNTNSRCPNTTTRMWSSGDLILKTSSYAKSHQPLKT